jgi:hypothetical protein
MIAHRSFVPSLASMLLLGSAFAPAPARADSNRDHGEDYGELMLEESFPVSTGGTLAVDIPDGNVELLSGQADRVEVKIYLRSRRMERARERYEEMDFRARAVSDGVLIEGKSRRGWVWGWENTGGFRITVLVSLPERYNVDVETSDGDVLIERLIGKATLKTSDGDVKVDKLEGPLNVKTADGDVRILDVTGETDVVTSDGNIVIRTASGPEAFFKTSDGDITADVITADAIDLHTSDGNIRVDRIEGREISARTGDGDVDLEGVAGSLRAVTGDGNILVGIVRLDAVDLQTGGGDIEITSDGRLGADVRLRGERVRVPHAAELDGRVDRHHVEGRLNGGGPTLRATARDGDVVLRLRDAG